MKKMSKVFLTTILFLCVSIVAQAQLKGFSVGGFLEVGRPTAGFEETHRNGVGVGARADINLPAKLGLMGSFGFMHFPGQKVGTNKYDAINAFPLRVGLKYRFPLLYAKLESGVAKISNGGGSAVILSPGIGIRFLGLDVQGNFEAWAKDETWSFWGLRIGYNF